MNDLKEKSLSLCKNTLAIATWLSLANHSTMYRHVNERVCYSKLTYNCMTEEFVEVEVVLY